MREILQTKQSSKPSPSFKTGEAGEVNLAKADLPQRGRLSPLDALKLAHLASNSFTPAQRCYIHHNIEGDRYWGEQPGTAHIEHYIGNDLTILGNQLRENWKLATPDSQAVTAQLSETRMERPSQNTHFFVTYQGNRDSFRRDLSPTEESIALRNALTLSDKCGSIYDLLRAFKELNLPDPIYAKMVARCDPESGRFKIYQTQPARSSW